MRMTALLLFLLLAPQCEAQELRLRRSLSGPSGHASGSTFVFDEVRSRFLYPADSSFIVYFEWDATPGLHTISAIWKSPDGRSSLSPDIKVELPGGPLSAYWTNVLQPDTPSGTWTIETRVDGMPGGVHTLQLTVPPPAPPAPTVTWDAIYRAAMPALVRIFVLNAKGERTDSALGFIHSPDRIATAFQIADGASGFLLRYSDGAEIRTDTLAGWSRAGDWALLIAPTGERTPLRTSTSREAHVGERLMAFTIEDNSDLVAAMVDLTANAGSRIRFNPSLPLVSAGSPLLDATGAVAGILGAWELPGSRIPLSLADSGPSGSPGLSVGAMSAIENVLPAGAPATCAALLAQGAFSPPLTPVASLTHAVTTVGLPGSEDFPVRSTTEFPAGPGVIGVFTLWDRKDKTASVSASAALYDSLNRRIAQVPVRKLSLGSGRMRLTQSFSMSGLTPGSYRIDVIANNSVAWRLPIRITR